MKVTEYAKQISWWSGLAAVMAVLLILITSVPGLAQTGPNTMNFQGRLLDSSGNPLSGTHCMGFRMCRDAGCATQVWPTTPYEYHAVPVASGTYKAGLFTVALGSSAAIPPELMYDEDSLFLEVAVSSSSTSCSSASYTAMSPNTQLRASAYAQRSRRVHTRESDAQDLISVWNQGQGGAIYARTDSSVWHSAAGSFDHAGTLNGGIGVYGKSSSPTGEGVFGEVTDTSSQNFGVHGKTASSQGSGVKGEATNAAGSSNGVWGTSSGQSGRGVWGLASHSSGVNYGVYGTSSSGQGFGVFGDGYHGVRGKGTLGVWGEGSTWGVYGTSSSAGRGVYGQAPMTGVFGQATSPSGAAYGVTGESASIAGRGVDGTATNQNGTTYGIYGLANSTLGRGVYGEAPQYGVYGKASRSAALAYGVYGETPSTSGSGVYGTADASTGTTYGVQGRSSSGGGRGVDGHAIASSGETYGVHGQSDSAQGTGVYGYASNGSGITFGVHGQSDSAQGTGVYGYASNDSGITFGVHGEIDSTYSNASAGYFEANAGTGATYGVRAENSSTSNLAAAGRFYAMGTTGTTFAIHAVNASTTSGAYGIYADCGFTGCYGLFTPDSIYAAAGYYPTSDIAEYLPAAAELQPGDVVMIDPGGGGGLVLAEGAYNSAVAGIISTQPGVVLGSGEEDGGEGNEGKVLLALAGTVPCQVSAENGPIHPGDLLTTSSTPGHAMRAEAVEIEGVSFHRPGTIIGKALEGWDEGRGTVQVLVTLQ